MLYYFHMTITELLFATPTPSIFQIILVVLGVLGLILITYGIFLEKERLQDAVFMIGALFLAVYSYSADNIIFTTTFIVFFLGSAWEYYQIISGKHKHVCYPCTTSSSKPKSE